MKSFIMNDFLRNPHSIAFAFVGLQIILISDVLIAYNFLGEKTPKNITIDQNIRKWNIGTVLLWRMQRL